MFPPVPRDKPTDSNGLPQLKAHPFELPVDTEFGKWAKPLVDQLKAFPTPRQTESLETFEIIWEYAKRNPLPDIKLKDLKKEDAFFLMGDHVGGIIRRLVTYTLFSNELDKSIITERPEEADLKESLIKPFRLNAWSRFVEDEKLRAQIRTAHPDAEIYCSISENLNAFETLVKTCLPTSVNGMMVKAEEIGMTYENIGDEIMPEYLRLKEAAKEQGQESPFHTDPHHLFKVGFGLSSYLRLADRVLGKGWYGENLPPLLREVTIMLVEDNPLQALWLRDLMGVKNLSAYTPCEEDQSTDPLIRVDESIGHFRNGERALEIILNKTSKGGPPPDVVQADIELGDPKKHMNGVEFVRRLYKRERESDREPMMFLLYSSRPDLVEQAIIDLGEEGITLIGHWNKFDFTPKKLIEAINAELKRRDETVAP